jgi:hypothetical protein
LELPLLQRRRQQGHQRQHHQILSSRPGLQSRRSLHLANILVLAMRHRFAAGGDQH